MAGQSQAASLVDVLNEALQQDPQLRAAEYNLKASQESKTQALANFLPQVNGSWNKQWAETESELDIIGELNVPDTDQYGWRVSLNQSVYDHANFVRMSQAELQEARGSASYDMARQDFLIRVSQSYFNVLTNIDVVRFAEAEEKAIEQQLQQAEQRYEVGLSAVTDVHEARAQYDSARANVINARNILDDSREALFEITQTYYQELAALPADIEQLTLPQDDVAFWESLALNNNPNLAVAKIDAELAEKTVDLQRSGHFPTVDLSVARSNNVNNNVALRDPQTQDVFATGSQETDSTSAQLTLTVPIFSGFRVSSLTDEARFLYQAAMENLDQVTFATVRNVRSALRNVEAGWRSVQARELAVVSAKSAEEATAAGFEVGTRNIVEVLNSQRSLYQAQRDYSRAKHDYLMNILNLKRAAGTLTQDDVLLINQLLTHQ
ncbi:TolC family outer membrane protein [Marinicella gelatinilytica]|uniref:TolC family outer membrane protein n=1 Tax=Marinicella gelatinilytica TaxID=2996017 RepID=UPI002260B619|nr:TolC family outer membrane protein [Marinicella gelatinilytica]MCX7544213.1 TolC family outer membrane protein [Marinicella gelatinilytica]